MNPLKPFGYSPHKIRIRPDITERVVPGFPRDLNRMARQARWSNEFLWSLVKNIESMKGGT